MNKYELYLILDPLLAESQLQDSLLKVESILSVEGGIVDKKLSYGIRKLAYPIRKRSSGACELFHFSSAPNLIQRINKELSRDERFIRFLITKLDKHAIAYNLQKGNQEKESRESEQSDLH